VRWKVKTCVPPYCYYSKLIYTTITVLLQQLQSYTDCTTCVCVLDPILIARALEDYYPGDCRFISLRQGQVVYVYALLKDRGNMFWAGSVRISVWVWVWVQGSYYGEQEARLGHFPSSVVEETHALMPAINEVMTDNWDFYCN
uniref:MIA SH3 domain containing n=1 Tax=Hucho hucho TaxID=62062 RepID=A0A4W5KA02_9TELE